jgi:hypothetical protein
MWKRCDLMRGQGRRCPFVAPTRRYRYLGIKHLAVYIYTIKGETSWIHFTQKIRQRVQRESLYIGGNAVPTHLAALRPSHFKWPLSNIIKHPEPFFFSPSHTHTRRWWGRRGAQRVVKAIPTVFSFSFLSRLLHSVRAFFSAAVSHSPRNECAGWLGVGRL